MGKNILAAMSELLPSAWRSVAGRGRAAADMEPLSQQGTERSAEAEARVRAVIDHIIDGIITIDERGVVETFNPGAERTFGYQAGEVIGHNVKMLMPAAYSEHHDQYLSNYLRTGQARIIGIGREVVGRRKDGSTFPLDLAVSEFRVHGRRMFAGILRDVTERKRARADLQVPRRRQRHAGRAGRLPEHLEAGRRHGGSLLRRLVAVDVLDSDGACAAWRSYTPMPTRRMRCSFGTAPFPRRGAARTGAAEALVRAVEDHSRRQRRGARRV